MSRWDDKVSTQIVRSISLAYQYTNVIYQEKNINDLLEGQQSGAEELTNDSSGGVHLKQQM